MNSSLKEINQRTIPVSPVYVNLNMFSPVFYPKYFLFISLWILGSMALNAQDCSGTPNPGATTSSIPSPVLPGTSFTLGIQNTQTGTGINYQWRSSTDGSNFTNIAGATSPTYTVSGGITATSYYRCYLKCTAANTQAWSPILQMNIVPPCSGTPNPGPTTSTVPSPVAAGQAFTLNITNAQTGTGISYQWRISTDGTNYSNIAGATNSSYTLPGGIMNSTYYKCQVKCNNTNTLGWSTAIKMFVITEVNIGGKIWSAKNLNVTKFRNGDAIPEAKTEAEWIAAIHGQKPAWCYYNNDPAKDARDGKLYNWFAVIDPRGLAPAGWHIPSDAEWSNLCTAHSTWASSQGMLMKSTSGWGRNNGGGSNSLGFNAFPSGYRDLQYNGAFFVGSGEDARWWSTTESGGYVKSRALNYNYNNCSTPSNSTSWGCPVRCIKD